MLDLEKPVFALRHLDNGSFICALKDGVDYLICYSELGSAFELRAGLAQEEFCEVCSVDLRRAGMKHLWLDGCYLEIGSEFVNEPEDALSPPPPCSLS